MLGGTRGLARVGGRPVIGGCSAAGKARRLSHVYWCLRRISTKKDYNIILAKYIQSIPLFQKKMLNQKIKSRCAFFALWLHILLRLVILLVVGGDGSVRAC
jgi:hypothetical protein